MQHGPLPTRPTSVPGRPGRPTSRPHPVVLALALGLGVALTLGLVLTALMLTGAGLLGTGVCITIGLVAAIGVPLTVAYHRDRAAG